MAGIQPKRDNGRILKKDGLQIQAFIKKVNKEIKNEKEEFYTH